MKRSSTWMSEQAIHEWAISIIFPFRLFSAISSEMVFLLLCNGWKWERRKNERVGELSSWGIRIIFNIEDWRLIIEQLCSVIDLSSLWNFRDKQTKSGESRMSSESQPEVAPLINWRKIYFSQIFAPLFFSHNVLKKNLEFLQLTELPSISFQTFFFLSFNALLGAVNFSIKWFHFSSSCCFSPLNARSSIPRSPRSRNYEFWHFPLLRSTTQRQQKIISERKILPKWKFADKNHRDFLHLFLFAAQTLISRQSTFDPSKKMFTLIRLNSDVFLRFLANFEMW